MEALMARFDLTDAEWTIIAPLLPGAGGRKNGRPRPDDRKVLNGIFFMLRTGTPWRDLPERYGPYTIYRQRNLIERFFNKLKHFRRVATRNALRQNRQKLPCRRPAGCYPSMG
jgi:transposase